MWITFSQMSQGKKNTLTFDSVCSVWWQSCGYDGFLLHCLRKGQDTKVSWGSHSSANSSCSSRKRLAQQYGRLLSPRTHPNCCKRKHNTHVQVCQSYSFSKHSFYRISLKKKQNKTLSLALYCSLLSSVRHESTPQQPMAQCKGGSSIGG